MMRVLWISGLVVLLDQSTKQLVLRTMYRGQQIPVLGDWLKFTFTENPGMAFGITPGPTAMVTVFSMLATALIVFYLYRVRKDYYPYRASLALILGGAVGNIIDRLFYGDALLSGKVVDFIHVNLWSGFLPESIPLVGGMYISLFPIWNVADMGIVCGVASVVLLHKKYGEYMREQTERDAAANEAGALRAPPEAGPDLGPDAGPAPAVPDSDEGIA